MFELIFTKIFIGIFAILTSIAGAFGIDAQPQFGANIPVIVADFQTALAVSITASSTSMTLIDGTDTAGNTLSGYMCFVIDREYMCGTTAGTAVSSLVRGIDPIDGDKHVYSLTKEHRRGASVKITNHPSLAINSRILNGDETIPNVLSYSSQPTFNQDEQLATKKYADDLAIAGSPAGSTTIAGIFQVANTNQLIHYTTTTGSTGKLLILPLSYFATSTDKRGATTTVVMTDSDGKIDQSFYDLTDNYSWSGRHVFTAEEIYFERLGLGTFPTEGTYEGARLEIKGLTSDGTTASIYVKDSSDKFLFYISNDGQVGIGDANQFTVTADGVATMATTTINGTITVTGEGSTFATSTFEGIPTLPDYDPTGDRQAVRKSYVDNKVDNKVGFPGTVVFNTNPAPTSFTDLDLSSVVGSNSALVYLRLSNSGNTATLTFRKNGETGTIDDETKLVYVFALPSGSIAFVSVVTDSAGIIEWDSSEGNTAVTISVEAYVK